MSCILIDTACPLIGVALYEGENCVAHWTTRQVQGADGWLGPALEKALSLSGTLERVAVSVGPGAFTGLRVGVATALGLAMARRVGVVPLSSLALRACRGEGRVLSLLDARKERVYGGYFEVRGGIPVAEGEEWDGPPARVLEGGVATVVGEGVQTCEPFLGRFLRVEEPEASPVGAAGRWLAGLEAKAVEEVALRYLRAPDAKVPEGVGRSLLSSS